MQLKIEEKYLKKKKINTKKGDIIFIHHEPRKINEMKTTNIPGTQQCKQKMGENQMKYDDYSCVTLPWFSVQVFSMAGMVRK